MSKSCTGLKLKHLLSSSDIPDLLPVSTKYQLNAVSVPALAAAASFADAAIEAGSEGDGEVGRKSQKEQPEEVLQAGMGEKNGV